MSCRAESIGLAPVLLKRESEQRNGEIEPVRWLDEIKDPSVEWLVPDLVPRRAFVLLAGRPEVGKGYLSLDLCRALATGTQFLGRDVGEGRSLFLTCEDPAGEVRDRLRALALGAGNSWEELQRSRRIGVETDPRFQFSKPEHVELIFSWVRSYEPDLVVLDNLRRLHRGSENSSTDIQPLLDRIAELTRMTTVLLLAHNKKVHDPDSDPTPGELVRGSSAVWAFARGVIGLSRRSGSSRVVVHPSGNYVRDCRPISVTHRNEGERVWFEVETRETTAERVVRILTQSPSGLTQSDTARMASLANGTARKVLDQLEREGRVERAVEKRKNKTGSMRKDTVWRLPRGDSWERERDDCTDCPSQVRPGQT